MNGVTQGTNEENGQKYIYPMNFIDLSQWILRPG